jgi:hypothetical protein
MGGVALLRVERFAPLITVKFLKFHRFNSSAGFSGPLLKRQIYNIFNSFNSSYEYRFKVLKLPKRRAQAGKGDVE